MKFRKHTLPQTVSLSSTAKARLRNVGNGTLELVDRTIKFYIEKGRFKKQKELSKEIPVAHIENVKLVENELSIMWKGVTYRFVIKKAELAEAMHARITEYLNSQRKALEAKEEELKQKANELSHLLSNAMKISDLLFDLLRGLHGNVDYNLMATNIERSKETIKNFADQGVANLNFTKISSAIQEHLPEEISKEAYNILRVLFEYFDRLPSEGDVPVQFHPSNDDAKKIIAAYYTLNDIILGVLVGDEVGKESNELIAMLDTLSKATSLQIDVDAAKAAINKLGTEKDKEGVIAESRSVFVQQLKELVTE